MMPVREFRSVPTAIASAPLARLSGLDLRIPFALMLGYFAAQVALRVLVSDSLELDEAEQMLATRTLDAGYGTQPPLYTWLQYGFFRVFGVSVFSLALAKNAMLFVAYAFTLLSARRLMPAAAAWLATVSMLWLLALSWDAQRDLTHTVLATTTATAVAYALVRVAQRPHVAEHLALGLALGLAVLAKYNNIAFAAVLGGAVVAVPALRRRLVSPRLAWTALGTALVVAPHALWLLGHWRQASAGTIAKMGAAPGVIAPFAWFDGLASAALAVVGFATPFWIVVVVFFGRRAFTGPSHPEAVRIVKAYAVLFGALLLALVFVGGVTHFKARWLVPGLFALPAMLFACRPMLAEAPRARAYHRTTLAFAVVLFVLLAAKAPLQGRFATPGDLNQPIGALAAALHAEGFDGGVVVTGERRLAGRLRLHFPDSPIVLADEPMPEPEEARRWLLIASDDELDALLERLSLHVDAAAVRGVELPYRYAGERSLRARYRYVLLDAAALRSARAQRFGGGSAGSPWPAR